MDGLKLFDKKQLSLPLCIATTMAYAVIVLAGILHHELWFDEAQPFCLSLASHSFKELFYNTRFEVHPPLWDLLLYAITRFSSNPFFMQVMNAALAVMAVCIFLRYSPFSAGFKLFFVFGYFM